jgi:membrane associated rhomboid family serine protease
MCQACRGLIAASVRTCPLCGRDSVPPAPARAVAHAGSPRFFTVLLISINVAVFIMMAAVDAKNGHEGSFVGAASPPVLLDFGERSISLIAKGQWWRLVTPIFIHLGIIHLLFNNFALFQIGPLIEETFGSQKFIVVYLCCGVVGNIGSFAFHIQGGGASGALFGLMALAAVYGYKMGGVVGRSLMRQMLIWGGMGLLLGMTVPGIDNVNHIGGLITGAALGFIITPEHPATARGASVWNTGAILTMVLVAASFAMVALHYGQANDQDLMRLSARVKALATVLDQSFQWKPGQDPQKIAGDLRSAADDIRRVQRIDGPSDAVRQRMLDLAARRAGLFDSADKDPSSVIKSNFQDNNDAGSIFEDYHNWEASVIADYGLVYQRTESR